jgi:XRE family transcriptional regulator, regulator of sulfur utilization
MTIGETISKVRKEKNLKQKDLAASCKISQTYLSQIEKGTKIPTLDVLEKISNGLAMPYPVLSFLSLDESSIAEEKRVAYNSMKPIINGIIKELFM